MYIMQLIEIKKKRFCFDFDESKAYLCHQCSQSLVEPMQSKSKSPISQHETYRRNMYVLLLSSRCFYILITIILSVAKTLTLRHSLDQRKVCVCFFVLLRFVCRVINNFYLLLLRSMSLNHFHNLSAIFWTLSLT